MSKTQQEVVSQGYQILVESLGIYDTLRFIQYFSPGRGDYTQERHGWLNQTSLDDIFSAMRQRQDDDTDRYDEVIE